MCLFTTCHYNNTRSGTMTFLYLQRFSRTLDTSFIVAIEIDYLRARYRLHAGDFLDTCLYATAIACLLDEYLSSRMFIAIFLETKLLQYFSLNCWIVIPFPLCFCRNLCHSFVILFFKKLFFEKVFYS